MTLCASLVIQLGGDIYPRFPLDLLYMVSMLKIIPIDSNEYLRALEEDAKERSEKRKEKEELGKEHKKAGNTAFKQGDFEAAIVSYSEAIKQMPWDITLYTNRAQVGII